ncbi:hypothetical protein C349_02596 [Cryptococcus neoformans var. grubii Br795]|nr:hypothetical protein C349_02596 [Cryptococcus neoformans var. grubii Br795]
MPTCPTCGGEGGQPGRALPRYHRQPHEPGTCCTKPPSSLVTPSTRTSRRSKPKSRSTAMSGPTIRRYHVVDFNQDGDVKKCMTHQGYADESTWSPGQSWAIYGYAQCGRKVFLETVFELLPESGVPWWDFDAPKPCPYDAHTTPLQAPSRPAACSCFIACSDPSIHARPSNTSSSRSSSSTT